MPRGAVLAVVAALVGTALGAQADPSGEWRTLHTAHFRVHFRPADRDVARDAAREAERAYGLLAAELRPPRGTIDLTVTDDADVANGFTLVDPSNRVTLLLTPPTTEPGLEQFDSWLRVVTVHELAHVFHLDRARGIWRAAQTVFGRVPGSFPNLYQPSWVREGIATFYESRFSDAGRQAGTFQREVLAADAGAGTSRSPWNAMFFTRWAGGLVPYAYGSVFFGAVAAAADSAVPRFVEATAKQLIPVRVGRPLRRAGAVPDLAAAWTAATHPAAPAADRAGGVALAAGLREDPVPRVSPDGRRVAYLRNDGRRAPRLVVADAHDLRAVRSRVVTGGVAYDWLGDTLVVTQLDFTTRWRVRSDAYRWLPDGAWRRTTRGARVTAPRTGGDRLVTLTLAAGDNDPRGVAAPEGPGVLWGEVVPSPDGRWIAATRHAAGHWSLVRWPAAAPESLETLVASDDVVAAPVWGPGGVLHFTWDGSGLPQVYRWSDLAGGGAVPITADPSGARSPALLPDGSVLYASLGSVGWELRRAMPAPSPARAAAVSRTLEPAPAVPMRETGYAAWPSLRPHFWVPLVEDAGRAGLFLGGATRSGDALGRTSYAAALLGSWDPGRVQGAGSLASAALGNPTLDVALSNDWSYAGTTGSGAVVSANQIDAAAGATFVRRRWRSTLSLRLAAEYEGVRYAARPDTAIGGRDLIGGSATIAVRRVVEPSLSVSPQDGVAWSLTYRRREEQGSAGWSDEVRSAVSVYQRLPRFGAFAHPVLALHAAAGASRGPTAERFSVGGVSSGSIGLVFTRLGGPSRAFPVRGYDGGARRGSRAVAASAELRLPVALVGQALGHLPVGADKLALSLFGDVGDAWDPGTAPRLTRLHAVGAEVVADLTYDYDVPLRLRVGAATPLGAGPARLYAALGTEF